MKVFWLTLGSVSLILGILGIFLPLLPTTPFLLLTAYCYAKGSEKFHSWFISSFLYKKYLLNYTESKTMTIKQKIALVGTVSLISLSMMFFVSNIYAKLILSSVIIGHILYFGFYIKTKKN